MRYNWTNSEKEKIKYLYLNEKLSSLKIAKLYKVHSGTIANILNKIGVTLRKTNALRKCNESYFEKVDTPNKAYILGFLYADGCIIDKCKGQKMLVINLHEQDVEILHAFSKELEFEGELFFYDGSKIKRTNYKYKRNNLYRLSISSNKLCDDLIKLGCFPRKTFTCKFPTKEQVPSHLINHFIRGLMDGDGYISIRPTKKTPSFTFGITGTLDICLNIQKTLSESLFLQENKKLRKCKSVYGVTYSGIVNVKKIFNYLYNEDSKLYLSRKYNKIKQVINY